MDKLYLVKIGGQIINDQSKLKLFLRKFSALDGKKILVHGGGTLATEMAAKLNIPQLMVEGRRITDAETLKVITMVYAGYVNKSIVAELQSLHTNAIGLSGVDGNIITARKREVKNIDYGFVGDINNVNIDILNDLLHKNLIPVISPITHDGNAQLLNTNADTIAQELATAMANSYAVTLIYGFERKGVLRNLDDENSIIKEIDVYNYQVLKSNGTIHSGMIPKIDNAFVSIAKGVEKVIIGQAEELDLLVDGKSGTGIKNG